MSYLKTTVISGTNTEEGTPCSVALNGHWKLASAWSYAKKRGWHNVEVSYSTSDMSGHGRGSRDGVWRFNENGTATQIRGTEAVDDSADIHAMYDNA